MNFSEKISRLMLRKGLNQSSLGEVLGLSQRAVGKWLQGSRPHKSTIIKLADYFSVPLELLERDDLALPEPTEEEWLAMDKIPLTGDVLSQRQRQGLKKVAEEMPNFIESVTEEAAAAKERLLHFYPPIPSSKEPWKLETTHPQLAMELLRSAIASPPGRGMGLSTFLERVGLKGSEFSQTDQFRCFKLYYQHFRTLHQFAEDMRRGKNVETGEEALSKERARFAGSPF